MHNGPTGETPSGAMRLLASYPKSPSTAGYSRGIDSPESPIPWAECLRGVTRGLVASALSFGRRTIGPALARRSLTGRSALASLGARWMGGGDPSWNLRVRSLKICHSLITCLIYPSPSEGAIPGYRPLRRKLSRRQQRPQGYHRRVWGLREIS